MNKVAELGAHHSWNSIQSICFTDILEKLEIFHHHQKLEQIFS